ncbi:histidine kinase N-terminal 7TM domain-containing protein [Halorubrum laminariae]|uniref:histidine kinase n=1 Tax=Halorubrum laminariae TaxID=1433523 RepID=A0ABD6BX33_9EURY|nr:histidine kinase N-terminal 7TM domain-containing protein [Halorubrum laminariae]
MEWQPTPFTAPLLVAAIASFGFAGYALKNRLRGGRPLVRSFVGVTVGAGLWALAYAAQLSATTLAETLFWNRFVWIGVGILAVAWPAFVLAYVDWREWFRPKRFVLLCAVPVAAVTAILAVGVNPFFYRSPALSASNGYLVLTFLPTPALIGFIAYTYVVNVFTFLVLGSVALTRDGVFRRQAALLLIAGIAPMTAGILGVWGAFGTTFVDYTPITFAGTSVVLGWVVFRHRLFDLSPVARDVVFANLSDGVVVVRSDRRIADVNDPARALFPSAAVGSRVDEAFEDAPAVIDAIDGEIGNGGDAQATGANPEIRVTIDRGNDPRILTVTPHEIDDDAAGYSTGGGTVLLFRDVTAQETLQRRYRALIEKSPNVIAVCGTDGLVRYASPSVERLLGHTPAEVEGRPAIDLVHPDDREESQRLLERAFETRDPQTVAHRLIHANGNWRQFETTVERLFEDTDEVVITATDVTESRRYKQRLQVLNRVLRHDLKNDANVIGGYAGLLRDHVDDEGAEYLDTIDRKVQTLTHLSDQAREIDVALHNEGGRATIDLAELLTRLCTALESAFPRATVSVSVPETAVVRADELLESAVRNVLENAVVHHDGGTPIVEASVDTADGGYRIAVDDDGPGIPSVERTVFSEVRETPLEHASGLGLWLVHWIVSQSGGDLTIEMREPRGTSVTIWLPAADDAELDPTTER